LKEIKGLNTLVLKNNAFENLGSSLHHCSALSKLSMAHNQISDLGDSLKVGTVFLLR
jgi:Leucine-rich repeat (LRR) protein